MFIDISNHSLLLDKEYINGSKIGVVKDKHGKTYCSIKVLHDMDYAEIHELLSGCEIVDSVEFPDEVPEL